MIATIIPAGGKGNRLGAPIPKQFLDLAGRPLILWTIERFVKISAIDLLVIPIVPEWKARLKELLAQERFNKPIQIVTGGKSRQDSVYQGLKILPKETRIILVHDAARPLVEEQTIIEVLKAIEKYGAAIAATPAKDTVKEDKDGFIKRTLPREHLYLAQTPQGARAELLKKAFAQAQEDGFIGTDEASLLERLSVPIKIVPSPSSNLKVTTPEDLLIAEALLTKMFTP